MKHSHKILLATLLLFFNYSLIFSQPHLEGMVNIDMNSGLIECHFSLSNLGGTNAQMILLNKGMNIKYFKDSMGKLLNYEGRYDAVNKGEATEYYFINDHEEAMPLPSVFYVEYKGAFPVYQDDFNVFDYKGFIAFNGQTVRAAEQTKWYPVIYDKANDRQILDYTYDLTVNITGGTTVFINGSTPQTAPITHFTSAKAYPLLLFAGNYDYIENGGDYILNADVDSLTARHIFENIDLIKKDFAENLDSEFTDHICLINHVAVSMRKEGSSWGFNTFPSFAFSGLDFSSLIIDNGKFKNDIFKFFGHEFAHNYFGNNVTSGRLKWFWLESFAEYLSFNIAEDACGREFLKETLVHETRSLEGKNFKPLDEIEYENDIDQVYRYCLGPLMLKCFEDKFGRERTNAVLHSLLVYAGQGDLTLELWKQAAVENGIPEEEFSKFERKYVKNEHFKSNIVKEIMKNYS